MKISLCIPAYNAEKFIRTAITSCIEQTQAPYEILLSDDGSSDRTAQILEEYANQPRVRLVSPPQRLGLGAHYRHLAMTATGSHLVILSGDDALHPNFVEVATQLLAKQPDLGMLAFSGYHCNAAMKPQSRFGLSYPRKPLSPPAGFEHFIKSCTYLISFTVWDANLVKALPPLPDEAGLATDWYWALRAGLESSICLSRQALGYYRYHEANSSHSNPERWKNHALEMLKCLAKNYQFSENLQNQIAQTVESLGVSVSESTRSIDKPASSVIKLKEILKSWLVYDMTTHPDFLQ